MIKLPEQKRWTGDGWGSNPRLLVQVKRSEKNAIYKVTEERTGKVTGYEVFRIKIDPKGKRIFDIVLEEDTEKYPTSETNFGKSAWAVPNLATAETYFERLENGVDVYGGSVALSIEDDEDDEGGTPVNASPEPSEPSPVASGDAPKRGRGRPRKTEKVTLNLPDVEFSVKELAELNKVQYVTAYQFVKEEMETGHVKTTREERRAARGPMTQLFEKVA